MSERPSLRAYRDYRDALGLVMAARRKDYDAMDFLGTLQPLFRTSGVNGLIAIATELLREIDLLGGDGDEVMRRFAMNLADREAQRLAEDDS